MPRSVTFTTAAPLDVGEPVLDRDGAVTGHVISCAPACGEAFDITVAVAEAGADLADEHTDRSTGSSESPEA